MREIRPSGSTRGEVAYAGLTTAVSSTRRSPLRLLYFPSFRSLAGRVRESTDAAEGAVRGMFLKVFGNGVGVNSQLTPPLTDFQSGGRPACLEGVVQMVSGRWPGAAAVHPRTPAAKKQPL